MGRFELDRRGSADAQGPAGSGRVRAEHSARAEALAVGGKRGDGFVGRAEKSCWRGRERARLVGDAREGGAGRAEADWASRKGVVGCGFGFSFLF